MHRLPWGTPAESSHPAVGQSHRQAAPACANASQPAPSPSRDRVNRSQNGASFVSNGTNGVLAWPQEVAHWDDQTGSGLSDLPQDATHVVAMPHRQSGEHPANTILIEASANLRPVPAKDWARAHAGAWSRSGFALSGLRNRLMGKVPGRCPGLLYFAPLALKPINAPKAPGRCGLRRWR